MKILFYVLLAGCLLLPYVFIPLTIIIIVSIYIKNSFKRRALIRKMEVETHSLTPPDNLRPIELGLIQDHRTNLNEFASILFYLIYSKHIKLTVIKTKEGLKDGEYRLQKLNSNYEDLREYERTFIVSVFGDSDDVMWSNFNSSLMASFQMGEIIFQAQKELQERGYYKFPGMDTNSTYNEQYKKLTSSKIELFMLIISGLGLGLARYITKKGEILSVEIAQFCNYLKVAEKERVDFHIDPDNENIYVSEYAPYAIALGINKVWGDELMGMRTPGEPKAD